MPVILTIFGISALIFIHEAGHFLCARLAGVRVHVFSLGFGNRLWGFVHKGTDYRISWLPLGGYVQVAGEDPTADRRLLHRDDLHSKGFWARVLFYSGGVIMNLLFALVVFPLVFRSGVEFDVPVLGEIGKGGAAWEAGLQQGDRIISVNGKEMYSFNNMRIEVALANAKRGAEIVYQRDGATKRCRVHARYNQRHGLRDLAADSPVLPGPYAVRVVSGSTASQAGLRDGDVLLEFDGQSILTRRELAGAVQRWAGKVADQLDKPISLKIRRPATDPSQPPTELLIDYTTRPTEKHTPRLGVYQAERRVAGLQLSAPAIEALGLRHDDVIAFINDQPYFGGPLDFGTEPAAIKIVVSRGDQDAAQQVVLEAEVPVADRQALADAIALVPADGPLYLRPSPGGAAELAGVRAGDLLMAINGETVEEWDELVKLVRANGDQPLHLTFFRVDGPIDISITPRRDANLGFTPVIPRHRYTYRVESVGDALAAGWTASVDLVKKVYVTLKKLFTGEVSTKNLSGIITIARVSYYTAQEGYAKLFYWLAMLSINLAVFNVLPIPVLDGGHLMFLLIERIKGSPVSTAVHTYSQILGLVFVLLLLIYVTYNDILKLF